MITKQLRKQSGFTNAEKQISVYVLGHPFDIIKMTANELGKETFTSTATVTRLIQKLGCVSYHEFQIEYDKEQTELQQLQAQLSSEPVNAKTKFDDIQRILPVLYDSAVKTAAANLDKAMIYRAVEKIRRAEKVDLYGSGVTESIAELCAFKFETLGIECAVHNGINEHYFLSEKLTEKKVMILFSLTGSNSVMCRAAEWEQGKSSYILGIGGDTSDALKKLCSDYISVPMEENLLGMEIMKSFNELNYAVDVLFTALVVSEYDRNQEIAEKLIELKSETK